MKDNAVGHIANKLNISKATASKAIRHCSGVDSDTRQSVLDEVRFIKYQPKSQCDIYAIYPDTPQYFWQEIKNGIRCARLEHSDKVKSNIYTKLSDETTVLTYLEEAQQLNARAIIISAHVTPKIREKLLELNEGRLVLLLSEYHEMVNTFFVGSDSYQDGYLMGKQYLQKYTDRKLILLNLSSSANIHSRLKGFRDAICEKDSKLLERAVEIDVDKKLFRDPKLLPSKMAPLLLEAVGDEEQLCLYSPFGLLQLPLILSKAKLAKRTICMCHDYFTDKEDPCVTVTCNQDVKMQGYTAVKLASHYVKEHNYPNEKINFVPSIIK